MPMTESRSTIDPTNLQEILDASASSAKQTAMKNLAQYLTPPWFAERMTALLPDRYSCTVVFDPQCGEGALLAPLSGYRTTIIGVDLDRKFRLPPPAPEGVVRLIANCVDVWRLLDEFYPDLTFRCQVANPPFGLKWYGAADKPEDSTAFTWRKLIQRAGREGVGYMIANRATIERLGLHKDAHAYLYQTFPVGIFDANVEIGVLHFAGEHTVGPAIFPHLSPEAEEVRRVCARITVPTYYCDGTPAHDVDEAFLAVGCLLAEEKRELPPFNIYLNPQGYLRTYLSTRQVLARKLTVDDIGKLAKIDKCHCLTLTTERDSRLLMEELVTNGTYTVQPEAKAAIESALRDVAKISCPIMDVTDFERVAYADENEALEATGEILRRTERAEGVTEQAIALTAGRRYPVTTGSYSFVNYYQRMRLHLSKGETYAAEHDMQLTGQDRFIMLKDDKGTRHRFLDRPDYGRQFQPFDHSDALLWTLFKKPEVPTIADKYPADVKKNLAVMDACEMLAGFEYYQGQRDYLSRVAVRDYALIGAATGTGKSLFAITLLALKAPVRALIVAPQGTTRGQRKDDEDTIEDMQASQWITELRTFAPGLQVFELFSEEDYFRIRNLNADTLPHGVYVSYYEAMFSNGAKESCSASYTDAKLLAAAELPATEAQTHAREFAESVGTEKNGIRCIVTPCLASKIGHFFDFVAYDEAHRAQKLSSNISQMMIRLQPRFKYALTATPIPNLVTDIFPLMGWLCVPGWYRHGVRNAAWPFAREDGYRFSTTFLSTERDLTQERLNKDEDPSWRGKCEKASPVISAPARLLKLIKPTMAFVSKEACNPDKPKLTVHDIRVQMGRQQARLYGHYMNRANVPADNAMVRAAMQVAILRDLCASPARSRWNNQPGLLVRSNFNPKTAAVLSLIRDILARRQQTVVVCSRLNQTEYLCRKLQEAGINYGRIDSSVSPDHHTEQANLFKSGRVPVMFMGIKCAQAHSFDLCPNLIVASLEYSFGSFEQASGRIDRVTSKLPMNIYCVLHRNSIEEIMFDVVATKGDAATICLRGQRVPRDFKPADLGEIIAQNFESFSVTDLQPEEGTVEQEWPALCEALRKTQGK